MENSASDLESSDIPVEDNSVAASYFLGDSDDIYSFDEEKLHRMAMRYRKISSQMIQIYLDSCHFGEQHIIQSMLQENALTDHVVNYRDSNGRTGLSYACEYGYDDIVKTLAKCGQRMVDPNIADRDGNSPLMYACQAGHELVVSILLNYFPSLDVDHINDFGLNSLMKAAIQGNSECARLLILSGASPFVTDSQKNLTADGWAIFCGRMSTADLIKRLKITLGPKLCSQCGYTKPAENCPGHTAGLCKTHTPNTSRLDIASQCNNASSSPRRTRHRSAANHSQCKVFVQCPSGSIIDIHSPEQAEHDSNDVTSDDRVLESQDYEAKFESQMLQLQANHNHAASSCPSIPNQTASVVVAKQTNFASNSANNLQSSNVEITLTSSQQTENQQASNINLLPNKATVSKKKTVKKRKGLRGRIMTWFACFGSQEIGSRDISPKVGSNSRRNGYRKRKNSGNNINRRGSYSRQAQISRRISFSS